MSCLKGQTEDLKISELILHLWLALKSICNSGNCTFIPSVLLWLSVVVTRMNHAWCTVRYFFLQQTVFQSWLVCKKQDCFFFFFSVTYHTLHFFNRLHHCELCAAVVFFLSFFFFFNRSCNMSILKIHAREIFDSRGNPTVEVDLYTKKGNDFSYCHVTE